MATILLDWGTEPCKYGHPLCSHRKNGPCLDEEMGYWQDNADRIDGYDQDDLGESPDF